MHLIFVCAWTVRTCAWLASFLLGSSYLIRIGSNSNQTWIRVLTKLGTWSDTLGINYKKRETHTSSEIRFYLCDKTKERKEKKNMSEIREVLCDKKIGRTSFLFVCGVLGCLLPLGMKTSSQPWDWISMDSFCYPSEEVTSRGSFLFSMVPDMHAK